MANVVTASKVILFLSLLTFSAWITSGTAQPLYPDTILFHGKIFTSAAKSPYVEALAIRGDRIVVAGSSKDVVALAGKTTKMVDLGGRTVIPGINDAHDHLHVEPDMYHLPLPTMDPAWHDVKDAIASATTKVPKGTWIAGGFGPAVLDDPDATRTALDALSPDHPVMLSDWTGHSSLLNTMALRKLGVSEDQSDPQGGAYIRNKSDGKLTGMTFEYATFDLASRRSNLASDEQATKQLQSFFQDAAKLGITTIQNMSNPLTPDRSVALFESSPPPVRVRVIWFGFTDSHGRLTRGRRMYPAHPAPLVTVSGTKWILDGTPIERSSAMRKPYADRATSGQIDFSDNEIHEILRESLRSNDQLMVHVVGDRTTETFLNAMDATGGEKVWASRRVRLEHGDGLTPDLVSKAKRLGVIVVQNPTHLTIGDLLVERFGETRAQQQQPLKSLLDAGIPVALGSDGPNNPYLNIMLASTYPRRPSEAITREQAVMAYTLTAAYAEFAEKDKGSLEPGKLADLAVLSHDIFTVPPPDLLKTESVLTLVGGKVVYDAKVIGER